MILEEWSLTPCAAAYSLRTVDLVHYSEQVDLKHAET